MPSRPSLAVDTHAHVFLRGLPMTGGRRYTPDQDATLDDYLGHLNHHGLTHSVLVQPSFLDTDNRYLLATLLPLGWHVPRQASAWLRNWESVLALELVLAGGNAQATQ